MAFLARSRRWSPNRPDLSNSVRTVRVVGALQNDGRGTFLPAVVLFARDGSRCGDFAALLAGRISPAASNFSGKGPLERLRFHMDEVPGIDRIANELNDLRDPDGSDSATAHQLDAWLKMLIARGGSDLLLVAGAPACIRAKGVVQKIEAR